MPKRRRENLCTMKEGTLLKVSTFQGFKLKVSKFQGFKVSNPKFQGFKVSTKAGTLINLTLKL
jgi:hypothetical protein